MHPKSEMTDAELISAGREEFAQIFHKYADAIYRYAVRRVGVDSGEDI
ncbi:MAG: RNA polymerase subunit sigma-70, partial [Corynebacteriales bacterium]|nr:RNA polymerase subunit sigma-70 [Mycobacteriales bacterium]